MMFLKSHSLHPMDWFLKIIFQTKKKMKIPLAQYIHRRLSRTKLSDIRYSLQAVRVYKAFDLAEMSSMGA